MTDRLPRWLPRRLLRRLPGRLRSAFGSPLVDPTYLLLWPVMLVAGIVLTVLAVVARWDLLAWLAAIAGASALQYFVLSGVGRRPARRVRLEGRGILVELRPVVPLAWLTTAIVLGGFFAAMAATEPRTWVALLSAGIAALALPVLPDLCRINLTRQWVFFDETRLSVRSWTNESTVDWDDVFTVLDATASTRGSILLATRLPAPSLTRRRRRWLMPLEPRPREGLIAVPAVGLDEPLRLASVLQGLAELPAGARSSLVNLRTVDLLSRRSSAGSTAQGPSASRSSWPPPWRP